MSSQLKNIPFTAQIERKKFVHQPFRTYYVEINDLKPLAGFFISVGYHWDGDFYNSTATDYSEAFLSLVIAGNKPENFKHINFNINLAETSDLHGALNMAWYKIRGTNPITDLASDELKNSFIDMAIYAINIAYFICDLHASRLKDIPNFNSGKLQITKFDNELPSSCDYERFFTIPYFKNDLTLYDDDSTDECEITELEKAKSRKAPHTRCGHWQHYWVGKKGTEERRRILKWVEETTVNCNNRQNLPNVKVKL